MVIHSIGAEPVSSAAEYIELMTLDLPRMAARLFPSQCAVCLAWPAHAVCDACVAQFAQPKHRCRTCAMPVPDAVLQCGACVKSPPPLDACLASVTYGYPWAKLIAQFKFNRDPGWAQSFASLMRSAPWVDAAVDGVDLLIPMPLSRLRLQSRGFNQALVLAKELSRKKTRSGVLLRIIDTPPQSSLDRQHRLTSLRHAFAVDPLCHAEIAGKHILLVDDVMTSGASLFTASAALKSAGAGRITGLVIARTE